jgi:pentatricopeptide repeat protein
MGEGAAVAGGDAGEGCRVGCHHVQCSHQRVRGGRKMGGRRRCSCWRRCGRAKGIEPDVITYNATTSACEKGGEWREKALQLLEEMRAKGVKPDHVITCAAVIGAVVDQLTLLCEGLAEEGPCTRGFRQASADVRKLVEVGPARPLRGRGGHCSALVARGGVGGDLPLVERAAAKKCVPGRHYSLLLGLLLAGTSTGRHDKQQTGNTKQAVAQALVASGDGGATQA